MNDTVYLLGAGFNQVVVDSNGLKPPLSNNFFQVALGINKFSTNNYIKILEPVFKYIERIWKKNIDDLRILNFNIEDFFTYLHSKIIKNNKNELEYLDFLVKAFLEEVLQHFEYTALNSTILQQFAKNIYDSKSNIITLNYDLILERIIEIVSLPRTYIPNLKPNIFGLEEVSDEELSFSHYNWNNALCYGMKFSQVQLQRAGIPVYVDGNKFYNHPENKFYDWKILKLHGSLNWFKIKPIIASKFKRVEDYPRMANSLRSMLLRNETFSLNYPPEINGWLLDAQIITPVLYKQIFLEDIFFKQIWQEAKNILEKCKKLIIIGYSFSLTDYPIKELFLDAFIENDLEELIIIDPNPKISDIVRELTHYNRDPIKYNDLGEYINKK